MLSCMVYICLIRVFLSIYLLKITFWTIFEPIKGFLSPIWAWFWYWYMKLLRGCLTCSYKVDHHLHTFRSISGHLFMKNSIFGPFLCLKMDFWVIDRHSFDISTWKEYQCVLLIHKNSFIVSFTYAWENFWAFIYVK